MDQLARAAKAVTAAVTAASAACVTAAQDGRVTVLEFVTIAGAAVVAGLAVYRVPNKAAE